MSEAQGHGLVMEEKDVSVLGNHIYLGIKHTPIPRSYKYPSIESMWASMLCKEKPHSNSNQYPTGFSESSCREVITSYSSLEASENQRRSVYG